MNQFNSLGQSEDREKLAQRVRETAGNVGQGRPGFILKEMCNLPEDSSGKKFHLDVVIHDEQGQNPYLEVALAYGNTDADIVPEDVNNSFKRYSRTAFTFSPVLQEDSLGLSSNYSHDEIFQTRFDAAHVSGDAEYGYDYNMFKIDDELAMANGVDDFVRNVAPHRAAEVESIIKGEYGEGFQPDSQDGVTFYNRQSSNTGQEFSI